MPRRRNSKESRARRIYIHLKDHEAAALYNVKGNSSNATAAVSLEAPTKELPPPPKPRAKRRPRKSKNKNNVPNSTISPTARQQKSPEYQAFANHTVIETEYEAFANHDVIETEYEPFSNHVVIKCTKQMPQSK